MIFQNCTPHELRLNDGTVFPPSGVVPRVTASFTSFENGICQQVFGAVTGLPAPQEETIFVVSAMVLAASDRADLVAPATGHPDCVRDSGRIVSVPGFVRR